MASVDGLASGLNTTDIINQLMQLERQPQIRLQNRQQASESAITPCGASTPSSSPSPRPRRSSAPSVRSRPQVRWRRA